MFLPNLFQSTLPRGERQVKGVVTDPLAGFQSTLPRGERRGKGIFSGTYVSISIHAPTWGATRYGIHISKH